MAKLIIGLAGEMGSGKGTVAKYVCEKYNGSSHRFSTVLRNILGSLHLEVSRQNISILSTSLRQAFGEDVLAKGVFHDAQNDQAEIVVIDGIRREDDIKYLKELPHFVLVYIDIDIERAHGRIITRGENAGDNNKTLEEFKKEHELNADATIPMLRSKASFVIENNGSLEDLHRQIEKIISDELG